MLYVPFSGHTNSDLATGENGVKSGATLVTHLFNAMVSVSISTLICPQIKYVVVVPSQRSRPNWFDNFAQFAHGKTYLLWNNIRWYSYTSCSFKNCL